MIAIVAKPAATPMATLRPLRASASEWNDVMPNPKAKSAIAANDNSLMRGVPWFKTPGAEMGRSAASKTHSNSQNNIS